MEYDLKLNDIANDLLILNKMTIDTLFRLDNCADCIALYIFYYKTAKWQKTNTIKANDLYVKKSLKWGAEKIKRTKAILKENGLINIIQRRKEGKIEGWYIEVSYLVTQKRVDEIKIKVEECNNSQTGVIESKNSYSNNSCNQEVEKPTSSNEDINALKEKINEKVYLRLDKRDDALIKRISALVSIFEGDTEVVLFIVDEKKYIKLVGFGVELNEDVIRDFKRLVGDRNVVVK